MGLPYIPTERILFNLSQHPEHVYARLNDSALKGRSMNDYFTEEETQLIHYLALRLSGYESQRAFLAFNESYT
ncbi:hypothetical protein HI914_07107 [Erysiphe necator]|nr:hypothetical protein HI914_07107 [Erysiphe necator]